MWQKKPDPHPGQLPRTPIKLGEQYPPGPQSESRTQLLPVTHQLLEKSEDEVRQSHGTPLPQSESAKQWS